MDDPDPFLEERISFCWALARTANTINDLPQANRVCSTPSKHVHGTASDWGIVGLWISRTYQGQIRTLRRSYYSLIELLQYVPQQGTYLFADLWDF